MARYRILPTRSRVWIEARSNVHPIHTEAGGLTGWLDLEVIEGVVDVGQAVLGHLEFAVENLKSGKSFEDRELRRRIDAGRHPTITGELTSMTTGRGSTGFSVRGDLTFRGVTRSFEDAMSIEVVDEDNVRLAGESTFDIRDFGMDPPRILMLKVQPVVTVRVEIIAEKQT